jgi:hypothetical protein
MRSLKEINPLYEEIIKEAEPIRRRRLAFLMDRTIKSKSIKLRMRRKIKRF